MSETETKSDLEAAFEAAAQAVDRVKGASADAEAEAPAEAEAALATDEAPVEAEASDAPAADGDADKTAAKIEALEAQVADWKSRAYRATADLENSRRRFQREREEGRKFAVDSLMKDLLPVVDNLERALGAAGESEDPIVQGVQMVLRQFNTLMKNRGAEPFDPLGEVFDPQLHEAMSQMESTEYEAGHICQVFQRGWKLYDRLVRPAMVIVAKAPAEPAADADETEENS